MREDFYLPDIGQNWAQMSITDNTAGVDYKKTIYSSVYGKPIEEKRRSPTAGNGTIMLSKGIRIPSKETRKTRIYTNIFGNI
ncbi:MAG: hypothetical protein NZ901_03560 [Geminocystis sp.]|nr:hypothetical protein [Geminocystis sp.]HIK37708.1 hypothetical protein [Geminocystis sp. M7585_C2015_104]MCS7147248.1 hypothetical protein [Geminocystis sp.]MCX8078526.1 hypothetical protein [Geminocystis sp.]MDW8116245.1 hypothetical protein [Geminocystis sp.]